MTALPAGFGVAIDAGTKELDGATLFGGSPARVLRLSASGAAAWRELRDGTVGSQASGVLARRLTDAGLAHPRPPAPSESVDATVLVPVRDRPALLDRCLTALGRTHPVLVIDDGSADAGAVAGVAGRHGVRLLRREVSGGPGAARNTGLGHVAGEFVAFLDSDCVPPPGWLASLAGHFADPLVAAVAPRIVAAPDQSSAGRYAAQFGSLDLGDREARVVPSTRVAYVPTAALVVRRSALDQLAGDGPVFDPALRYGEDVDLVWRLHEAGWRIRYDPSVRVEHREPDTWASLLTRRFRYGTSAAPLTRRHPGSMAPLVLHVWPTATVVALLARRPVLAAAAFTASVATPAGALRAANVPTAGVIAASGGAVRQTWLGLGRYLCQFAAPALLGAILLPGKRKWGRRAAIASLLLGPVLTRARGPGLGVTREPGLGVTREPGLGMTHGPGLGVARRSAARLADDAAYGAGVWTGCVRERTLSALVPAVSWRPLRIATTPSDTERPSR